VVRTRKVGHFFPGGTVDAFEVWLELQATDEKGQTIFWSGRVANDGKGQVDEGAHFYRSRQIDGHGNVINKRNAWSTRAVVYVRLIPPGAADTVHYRLHIPENCGEKITLHAKLNYRKFMWFNNQFSYAGVEDANAAKGEATPNYDDRKWAFNGDTSGVAGKLKEVPTLPITVVAQDTKELRVIGKKEAAPAPQVVTVKEDWMRWNDYGIGLFLQGDLRNAGMAFEKVTQADPQNPDVMYLIVGATHPHVKRHEGEAYRLMLETRAQQLGVEDHLIFHNRFVAITAQERHPMRAIEAVMASCFELSEQDVLRNRVLVAEQGRLSTPSTSEREEQARQAARSRIRELEFAWSSFFAGAMRDGAIPETDPRLLTRAVLGLYNSIWHWYRPNGAMSMEEVTEFFLRRQLALLGLPPEPRPDKRVPFRELVGS